MREMIKMKDTRKYILTGLLSILVISGSLLTVKSLAFGNESANGQGKLFNEDGSHRQFSFNVRRNPNGKVVGQATMRNPSYKTNKGQSEQIKIDITCLKVVGNVAIMGGVTKRKGNQTEPEAVYFAVEDNGDENGADKIFRGFFFDDDDSTQGDAQRCESFEVDVLPFEPIAEGNIQVNQ